MARLLALLLAFAVTLSFTPSVSAAPSGVATDGPPSSLPINNDSFIVLMAGDPAISYDGGISGFAATRPAEGRKLDSDSSLVRAYQSFLVRQQDAALRAAGASPADKGYSYTVALNGFTARLTPRELLELSKQPGVIAVLPDTFRFKQTDSSGDFLGLDDKGGPYDLGYTGEDIVIGVIDTGIWPEHPSLFDDGSYDPLTLPRPVPCEFGNTAHNPDDAPFTCNNKLLGARQMLATYRALVGAEPHEFDSARDDDGHGTHTATTAAGNANVQATLFGRKAGKISGIAPRARVIAYKGLGELGGFTSDLAAAIDAAVADGVDVINYSIGGGASLNGADDIAFLFAAQAGVFVATSAGNSGPGPATIGGPASVPWLTTVGASTQKRFFEGKVRVGNKTYTGASITRGTPRLPLVDAANVGIAPNSEFCLVDSLDPAKVAGKIVLCKRGINGRIEKSLAVYQAGGAGMILYNADDTDNLFTDSHWVPSIHIDFTPGLAIKNYIARTAKPTAQITSFSIDKWRYAPSMTIFSSRGPNPVAEDIIKPDVTAPGLQILAGNSPATNSGVPGEYFQAIAGTSMSSPHVAGLFALIKQAHPDWSPAMAKSALMTTAYQRHVLDNDRKTPANPFAMGAGHVDPAGQQDKGTPFEPGLVYDAGFNDYLGFLCDMAPEVFANPAATCAALEAAGIPTLARNLNLPSIGIAHLTGSETIQRTVTSVADRVLKYKVKVKAPAGYKVTVTPSEFELAPGESVTYSVTITNRNAPIGEWRFGSLTWRANRGGADVYSPIAVRAEQLSAPASVSGSGSSGSLSFPVRFGYNGPYTAAAHGLVPATITSDTVVQDPNQDFDPNDGFSNVHQFTLNGAAHFRIAIPPEATEAGADLDVYVFGPDNTLVASSTSPGTNEQVDISLPADGTWTVYVHGWLTVGADSPYEMATWVVPLASGGSLQIDSAPTTATSGQTGTVSVSWSGLSAGPPYLGAVSHSDASSLLGLTLVEVTP